MSDDDLIAAFLSRHAASCPDCGYSLKESTSSRCPECGTPLRLTVGSPSQVKWPWLTSFGCSCTAVGTGLVGWILGLRPWHFWHGHFFAEPWYGDLYKAYFMLFAPAITLGLLVLQKPFREKLSTASQSRVAAVIVAITLICYGFFIAEAVYYF